MRWLIPLLALPLAAFVVTRPPDIPFDKHTIDLGASESAAVCDINGDGRLDIVSGENWYEAPHWTKHHFRDIYYTNNYIDDLSTLPLDVDKDGHVDLITSGWYSKKIAWWRNPGKSGEWKENVIDSGHHIEFFILADLDNDGTKDEVLPQFGDSDAPAAWYERGQVDGAPGMIKHVISDRSYGHGIGAGDINGDGRNDVLTPQGWLEAPADPRSPHWKFHPDWKFDELGYIYVADVNGDGRPDILSSYAHDYGIFWLENKGNGKWEQHMIDNSWSQPHAVTMVDLRGTGNIGLLTGKRYMAHNGKDPGAREPLGVYWYERMKIPGTNEIEWARHVIDYGGRTGGGINIPVADFDGDGGLDFVVAGKSGLFLFENKIK